MGILFESRGGVARQDVSAATDMEANSKDDGYASWIAYRKARKDEAKMDGVAGTKK